MRKIPSHINLLRGIHPSLKFVVQQHCLGCSQSSCSQMTPNAYQWASPIDPYGKENFSCMICNHELSNAVSFGLVLLNMKDCSKSLMPNVKLVLSLSRLRTTIEERFQHMRFLSCTRKVRKVDYYLEPNFISIY